MAAEQPVLRAEFGLASATGSLQALVVTEVAGADA